MFSRSPARSRSAADLVAGSLTLAMLAGCSGGDGGNLPANVSCASTIDGGNSGGELTTALSQAQAGDCVVVHSASYEGSFVVGAGVTLVAEVGADAQIKGTSADAPAIDLVDSAMTALVGVHVVSAAGNAVSVHQSAKISNVRITGAAKAAIVGYQGPDSIPSGLVALDNVDVSGNAIGLWSSGINIVAEGGDISDNGGESLSAGFGIIATGKAHLELHGTLVQNNAYGIIVEGASTTAHLTDVHVIGSTERGIWAQNLDGTLDKPALLIDGAGTLLEKNALCGLGAEASMGVTMSAGVIRGTIAKPVVTDLSTTENVGDGMPLLDGTGQVQVSGVTLDDNARVQALIYKGAADIHFKNMTVNATGSELKIVIQDTTAAVDVDPSLVSVSPQLGVADALVQVPSAP